MKAAWRQQQLRGKRKGKTEFSLVISKEKKSKLKALSSKKGKSLNETLEELIDDESARQTEHQKKILEAKKELNQRLEMARGAQALLYLLDEYIKKMVQCEIDAFKANHASIHDHIGTKDYKESRLSAESEAINQALSKIPAWKKRTFPLDISTKINIKSMLKT